MLGNHTSLQMLLRKIEKICSGIVYTKEPKRLRLFVLLSVRVLCSCRPFLFFVSDVRSCCLFVFFVSVICLWNGILFCIYDTKERECLLEI